MSQNVDPAEIQKFDAMASVWWDPNGPMKPLHQINPLRLEYIENHVELKDKNVLDIGCGGGILSEALAKSGANVTAIDMAEDAIAIAKKHGENLNINYIKSTAEDFAKKHSGEFDLITCMEMLEHVPNPSSIVEACSQLIKPEGHVFFSTINRNPKSYFLAILAAEYILRIIPKGTHEYEKLIRPSELENWARHSQLNTKDITGLNYNPLTKEFKLSKDVSVNYFLYCRS